MQVKEFLSQFMNDWKKIIWPGKNDVFYFFLMTILLATVFGFFFLGADKLVSMLVNYLLGV